MESEAKLALHAKIRAGTLELVWSSVIDFENSKNPFLENRHAISQWRSVASQIVEATPEAVEFAKTLTIRGVRAFDALHVASAIMGKADLFITTDDRLLKKIRHLTEIKVFMPGDGLAFLENWYEQ